MRGLNWIKLLLVCLAISQGIALTSLADTEHSSWDELARQAFSEDAAVSKQAFESLQKIPNLEKDVRSGIHSKNRIEALELIRAFHLHSLFPEIVSELNAHDDERTWATAVSIANDNDRKELSRIALKKIQNDWRTLPDSGKRAVLAAAFDLKCQVPAKTLTQLLSDSSYEVRIESAQLAGELLRITGNEQYSETLKKSLQTSPYQLRLEAIGQIKAQPLALKRKLRSSLKTCAKDENLEVQNACASAQMGTSS
jgi:hypothetical protein